MEPLLRSIFNVIVYINDFLDIFITLIEDYFSVTVANICGYKDVMDASIILKSLWFFNQSWPSHDQIENSHLSLTQSLDQLVDYEPFSLR